MATTIIQGLGVAVESAFGSIDSATGLSDPSGLTFTQLEFERAAFYEDQATVVNERNEGGIEAYDLPAEPVTMWSGGARVVRRQGTITVSVPMRTIGAASAYATYSVMPLSKLMSSCFGTAVPTASLAQVASGTSTTIFVCDDAAEGAHLLDGTLFKAEENGRVEFAAVTNRTTDTITHSPAVSSNFWGASDTVRTCNNYYAKLGVFSSMPSVALVFDGDGRRFWAAGCRVSGITWRWDNYRIMADLTIRISQLYDEDDGATVVDPTRADGAVAHALGSYVVHTPTIGTTTPAALARTALDVVNWSCTFTPTLAMHGHSDDIIGYADLEITNWAVEASVTFTPNTTFKTDAGVTDLLSQTERSWLFGCGPTGAGNGMAIYIPAAVAKTDALPAEGEESRQVMNLTLGAGNWTLDSIATAPGDTNFRVGLAL